MGPDPDEAPVEVSEQQNAGGGIYWRQLGVTLVLLALYWLGGAVWLPLVDREAFHFLGSHSRRLTVLALGVSPLLTGFILVELFSLLTGPGKRLRRGGMPGRATLNRAALVAGLLVAAVQASGIALFLETLTSPGGMPAVASPGWTFRILVVATLTGATAVLFALGNFLSSRGIGNGFCLFILTDLVGSAFGAWQKGPAGSSPVIPFVAPVLLGLLLFTYFKAADRSRGLLAAFPQGIPPAAWALTALSLPSILRRLSASSAPSFPPQPWMGIVALLVLVPVLSWVTFHLFSGPSRVKSELAGDPEELAELARALRHRLKTSTGILTLGTVALFAWNNFQPVPRVSWIDFAALVIAVAIGLDLRDQYRFVARHGTVERLLELDNVHFSHRLADRLQGCSIDVFLQARRFRSLLFFFGPLVKIGLLVPRDQVERAWQEIEQIPVEVV